eukprot:jgi/Ulvmu1/7913/UM004_0145.1
MPDAGTAFDGSVWVASTSAVGLVFGSAAVTALGAAIVTGGILRAVNEPEVADDRKAMETAAAQLSLKEEEPKSQGRKRIKRS